MGLAATGFMVPAGFALFIGFVGRRLSQSHIELTTDALRVAGQTSQGFQAKSYRLQNIECVTLRERLNVAERLLDRLNQLGVPRTSVSHLNKDLKAGRLLVESQEGGVTVFHFVDKALERESLLDLLAELARRGVSVEVAA